MLGLHTKKLPLLSAIAAAISITSPAIANEDSLREESIQAEPARDAGPAAATPEGKAGFERPKLSFGGEWGVAVGSGVYHELAPTWGVHAGAYVLPVLVTGLAFTRAAPSGNEGEWMTATAVTARASLHPFPDFFIDPWIAVDGGYAYVEEGSDYGGSDPEVAEGRFVMGFGLGLDVVIADVVAFGPHASGFRADDLGWRGFGVHAEGRF